MSGKRAWTPLEDIGLRAAGKSLLAAYASASGRSLAACQIRLDRLLRAEVTTCPTCGQQVTAHRRAKARGEASDE